MSYCRFIIELVLFGTTLFYEWVWLEAQGQPLPHH